AFAVEEALVARGVAAYVLDGDNVRFGLNRDLGFSAEDRTENIRRIGEVCRLFQDAGLVVLSAFISPYRADRDSVRALHPVGAFVEVFVDTPLDVCEERDVKGLYVKARTGEISDFSGISAPYEAPESPDLTVDATGALADCVAAILRYLDELDPVDGLDG
ncbi:MAG TPA: adenylyl-sulfate kinase, partial [Acidimicrobiaceae bacterium]|nr:adenylyl-sulfate kinase [Acidimicrobiaceae bacterium]